MKNHLTSVSLALLAVASTSAIAQSTTKTTDHPKAIGVSQSTADEAHRKAAQRGDVATVVRTGPSAKDKADDAAATVKDKADDATTSVKDDASRAKRKVKTDVRTHTTTDTTKP